MPEIFPDKPQVSVIIPTFNSSRTLGMVIESVISQTYPYIEIIVIDNNSTDTTKTIAKKFGGVQVLNKGPERSVQRNFGVENSQGKYLIFLDSDIVLSSGVIEDCLNVATKGFEVITFPEVIVGTGFWAECRALEAKCYLGDDTVEAPRFYSRRVFKEVGGFDETVTGVEDWDLRERAMKRGYKIGRISAMTMHHESKVNPILRVRKKYYYGKTIDRYVHKYKGSTMKQVPLFRSCYYRNWRMLVKDPVHTLGFVVLKTLETFAAGLGLVANRMAAKGTTQ